MREKIFLKYKIESVKLPLVAYFFIILGVIVFRQISISMVGKEYFQIEGIELTTIGFLLISFLSITLGTFFVALYYRANNLGRVLITALIVVSFIGLNLVVILFPTEIKRIVSYSPRVIGIIFTLGIIFTMFNFKIIKKIKVEG